MRRWFLDRRILISHSCISSHTRIIARVRWISALARREPLDTLQSGSLTDRQSADAFAGALVLALDPLPEPAAAGARLVVGLPRFAAAAPAVDFTARLVVALGVIVAVSVGV